MTGDIDNFTTTQYSGCVNDNVSWNYTAPLTWGGYVPYGTTTITVPSNWSVVGGSKTVNINGVTITCPYNSEIVVNPDGSILVRSNG